MKTLLRTLVCSFVVATTLVLPTSADAGLSDAAYPTLMRGARGHDVTALQYLLNFRGYPVTVDGVFGSSTDTQVRAFQTAKGLTSDGVVGPATWGQLKVTLQQGSTGDAVRAMEWLLNAKRDPDNPQWSTVTINGSFSASDKTVVQAFQNEVGLTADGIVGTNTWTRLLWHFRQLTNQGTLCLYPASRSSVDHAWLVGTGAGWTERAATLNYDHGGDGLIAFQDGSYGLFALKCGGV